jgi:trans-aconitate methyltransferase
VTVFGEAAEEYADIRPGFPSSLTTAIAEFAGPVGLVVEIGAGTGKGTAVFRGLGGRFLCVEPDALMAEQLRRSFPDVEVEVTTFEAWKPPAGGVPLLVASLVWHWLDEATRCRRAHAALAPGGALAVVGRGYGFADPDQGRAISDVLNAAWPEQPVRPPDWIVEEIAASALFADVSSSRHDTSLTLARDDYVRLVTTFSPFLKLPVDHRARVQSEVRAAVEATGGAVDLDMATTLTLARRDGRTAGG